MSGWVWGWREGGEVFWLVGLRSYFSTRRMPYRKTIRDESSSKNFRRHNVFAFLRLQSLHLGEIRLSFN